MEERFHGNLDPRAQEFRPSILNPNQLNLHLLHQLHPQQLSIYPPPPTLYLPSYAHPPLIPHQYSLPPPQGPAFYATPPPPPIPPVVSAPSRTLLLSSVPVNSSESLVLMELQAFGEVRALEMERVYQGIVTVHFYDLRHAQRALTEIRQQHMHHQNLYPSLASHHHTPFYINGSHNTAVTPPADLSTYPATGAIYSYSSNSPSVRGLIAGCPVWAQYVIPMSACFPDGHNQGTIVLFNLDSGVSTSTLKQIFESFGPVRELRETPMKRRQKFVEFYDTRDAAKALEEMNGKELHGRNVVIEFSRPGGYGRRLYNNTKNSGLSYYNCSDYQTRPPPPSPPKPLHCHPSTAAAASESNSDDAVHSPPYAYFNSRQRGTTTKKPNSPSGKDGSVAGEGLENSMASLGIIETRSCGSSSIEERNSSSNNGGGGRRNYTKRGNGNFSTSSSRGRSNKLGKQKNYDSRFLIKEDPVLESTENKDPRTTVMIKNIPNKYSQKLLLNMLDNHCIHCNEQIIAAGDHHGPDPLSSYDFVYLPIDFNNKCNVGYGFVNMTSPEATLRLYKAFHLQSWEVFNSRKICEITYARVQGLEALKEHFKNSKFPSVEDEIFPVVFAPPRDGKSHSEPIPIYGITPKAVAANTNGGSNNFIMTVTAISKAGDDDHHRHIRHHHDEPSLGDSGSCRTSHTSTTEADELEGDEWIDNDGDQEDDDTTEEDRLGFGNDENNNNCCC